MAHSGNPVSKGVHEDHQLDTEAGAPRCGMNPQLAQGKNGEDQFHSMFKLLLDPHIVQKAMISAGCRLLSKGPGLLAYAQYIANKLPPLCAGDSVRPETVFAL